MAKKEIKKETKKEEPKKEKVVEYASNVPSGLKISVPKVNVSVKG